jgi:hypothetical protein
MKLGAEYEPSGLKIECSKQLGHFDLQCILISVRRLERGNEHLNELRKCANYPGLSQTILEFHL